MPTMPPSVAKSTTLLRKYVPWQPLAAKSGGSGSAIGVTVSPVIVKGRFAATSTSPRANGPTPPARMPPAAMRIQSRRFGPMDSLPLSRDGQLELGSTPPQGPVDVALGLLLLERLALVERLAPPGDAQID